MPRSRKSLTRHPVGQTRTSPAGSRNSAASKQLFREQAQTAALVDETRSKLRAAEAGRDEVRAQVKSAVAALAEARARCEKARSDVATTVAHIDVARFDAERAQAMDSYTKLAAPYDGVVIRRKVDPGQLTTPGTTGEPLFVLARFDIVTISVGVPEAEAPFVNAGDAVQIRLPALEGRTFPGRVTRTAFGLLESATRTLSPRSTWRTLMTCYVRDSTPMPTINTPLSTKTPWTLLHDRHRQGRRQSRSA